MEKIKNINDASSFWFFVLAFFYVAMVLGLRNGYLVDFFLSLMRILDLPFAFVSLLYAGTTIALQLDFDEKGEFKSFALSLALFIVCLLLFGVVVIMNFGIPATL